MKVNSDQRQAFLSTETVLVKNMTYYTIKIKYCINSRHARTTYV